MLRVRTGLEVLRSAAAGSATHAGTARGCNRGGAADNRRRAGRVSRIRRAVVRVGHRGGTGAVVWRCRSSIDGDRAKNRWRVFGSAARAVRGGTLRLRLAAAKSEIPGSALGRE